MALAYVEPEALDDARRLAGAHRRRRGLPGRGGRSRGRRARVVRVVGRPVLPTAAAPAAAIAVRLPVRPAAAPAVRRARATRGRGAAEDGARSSLALLVADRHAPVLLYVPAVTAILRADGVAWRRPGVLAARDQVGHVQALPLADDDVVAARIDGVAGRDRHPAVAGVAPDLEPADDAGAVEVPVVQAVLRHHVRLLAVQLRLGQELAGEEARALETLETGACRTAAGRRVGLAAGGQLGPHGFLP